MQRRNARPGAAQPEPEPEHDEIERPAHYNAHPSGVECIDIVEHLTFCVGNAIKYAWRAGLKLVGEEDDLTARIRDLKKGRWYLNREIERLQKQLDKESGT